MGQSKTAEPSSVSRQNRFLVILLVGAAVVSAAKDLGRLRDLTSGAVGLAASWHERLTAATESPANPSCSEALAENDRSSQPGDWNGRVALDRLLVTSANDAAPVAGGGLVASTGVSGSESVAALSQISPVVSESASRTQQRSQFSSRKNSEMTAESRSVSEAVALVQIPDVDFDFALNVPPSAEFVNLRNTDQATSTAPVSRKRILKVCPLGVNAANAVAENASLDRSNGQAWAKMAARILGRKNKAKSANADRAQVIEFKTGDRIVTLDLLQLLRARIAEGSLGDDAASAESPRAIREVIQRTIRVEPAAAEETH